jgi:hypothetical protein
VQQNISSIFLGVPPANGRNYLADILKNHKFKKYVLPCVGRFAGAQVVVKSGVKPEDIISSDVGLFSTLLGYYITGKDIESLEVELEGVPFDYKKYDTQEGKIAEIYLAIKYLQLPAKHYYNQALRDEITINHDKHHAKIVSDLKRHKEILGGCEYHTGDALTEVRKYKNDPEALIFINPPSVKDGYKKMFNFPDNIYWKEPFFEHLNPDDFILFMDEIQDSAATIIVNMATEESPKKWTKLFAEKKGDVNNKLFCNKKFSERLAVNKKTQDVKLPRIVMFDDHEITKKSEIKIVLVNKEIAYHYRDMFIHRLGGASAQLTLAIFIDNQLMSVAGFDPSFLFRGDASKRYIHETYGMTVPSTRYPKLGRLFMYFLTCVEFRDRLVKLWPQLSMTEFDQFKTVCLTRLPEMRANHGLMKITDRDRTKNGFYKLVYETTFHKRNFKECIILWLDELRRAEQQKAKQEAKNGIKA